MAGQNQAPNVDMFDTYFRRADLDRDGRISGAEAVAFFQGSNLPKQVLAQIWMHADQNQSGFLGRAEFYNALKLVTVAQSKRELTPDIVKAALYGPAAAKIPAPQINLGGTSAPQISNMTAVPSPQIGAVAPTSSQNVASRGPQGIPNAIMNQQFFPLQDNQFMRPQQAMPAGSASLTTPGVTGQGYPGTGTLAGPRPPNSNVSTDWLGGRISGAPAIATSQISNRGISPSASQGGFGLAPSGLPPSMPPGTSGLTTSVAPKPQDQVLASLQPVAKDSKALVVSGNGFTSDTGFGGDVFSAKKDSSAPTFSASSVPMSSAIVPVSKGPQPPVTQGPLDSLQSPFMTQPAGGQLQQPQSLEKQNQQVSTQNSAFISSGISVSSGNSAPSQSHLPWPKMTQSDIQKYTKVFVEVDTDRDGKITGEQARNLFLSWRLPREVLKQVWDLSDQDNDSMLSLKEFCTALYLMERYREGRPLPAALPSSIMFDEKLLSITGQPPSGYGTAAWGSTAGFQQQQRMPAPQTIRPAGSVRPPMQVPMPSQADERGQPSQQNSGVPVLEKNLVNQLSKEEQNSLNSKFQEATEADKKVEESEKVILDSKEKIEFYRSKMQELVLYKSRCDNRLNEITERAAADKREAESLAKKYEEKYKQVGEIASKLTIEEATFREVQERKMELYQAIVKMEQGGSADGILQVRADRIQSDLEELAKGLNERCKKHGLHVKPTTLIELPLGWQPGIQEGAAVWDEDWDKFEDEGFTFVKELSLDVQNVIAPPKPKSTSIFKENISEDESFSAASSLNVDIKPEKPTGVGEQVYEFGSAYAQSEDGSARSPPGSPAGRSTFESTYQDFPDTHSGKNIGADGSPRAKGYQSDHGGSESMVSGDKSFDEPTWGTFDTNDDSDSVWNFNKDLDQESHRENSFFGSSDFGLTSIRTESPQADSMFQKKSPFNFGDSVPSTPLFNSGNSPRYSEAGDHSFDNLSRFDSFSMHDSGPFAQRETLARFDSIRSTNNFGHGRGFSSFDEADPFGSTGPFKPSSESQTTRRVSDNWSAF
ncbi:PREDICTED: actin cytoskeleton-regulatory complex protein PAN1 [Nelumbo nucifera]|uniref:Actin cytoskeleton-regulatory complex protein PAN1 n=1 Tax=Nelumbo nucifera TaxID=4432 RepID=A0A1U8ATL4_NELNU|nr:PREDICTED: actin cytoskeleton-regulatory complex protein PAN1 [Nelumbo nucifera]